MHRLATSLLLSVLVAGIAQAQVSTRLIGTAYLDYAYHADSPNDDLRNSDGFTYRRIYLGADAQISETVDARIRFSADRGTVEGVGARPYVKDAYLRWRYAGRHSATLGVAPPPVYDFSERAWGYRSLEQTLIGAAKVANSRDFGIRFDGPLSASGAFTYALMYANNNYARPEADARKRVYGQVAYTSDVLLGAVSSNYGAPGTDGPHAWTTNILIAIISNAGRIGGEAYVLRVEDSRGGADIGGSVFAHAGLSDAWEAVVRADRFQSPAGDATILLGGLSYTVASGVRLMPNVLFRSGDGGERDLLQLRLTAELSF